MKKALIIILILALAGILLVGCNDKEAEFDTINIIMPDGAPALSAAKLLSEQPNFDGHKVSYKIVAGAEGIKASVLSGQADIAILPTNLAAAFYNKGIDIKILSSNIFGLLYLLGKEDITSVSDLKGKVVYNIAQGSSPDFVFQTVLDQNNVKYSFTDEPDTDEVGLVFVADATALIAQMAANTVDYAILGEPQATQAVNKTKDNAHAFKIILDLQQEWQNGYPQVSTVAKASLIAKYPEFIDAFLDKMQENVAWVTENAEKVQLALTNYDSKVTFFNADSIARCNIRFEKAEAIKERIEEYLELMYNFDKSFVGGKLPDEGLYYIA